MANQTNPNAMSLTDKLSTFGIQPVENLNLNGASQLQPGYANPSAPLPGLGGDLGIANSWEQYQQMQGAGITNPVAANAPALQTLFGNGGSGNQPWFKNPDTYKIGGEVIGAATDLFGAWTAYQANKDANKRFDTQNANWREQYEFNKGNVQADRAWRSSARAASM